MTFASTHLNLELLDPASVNLFRLFRHPGGDWDPPDPEYRTLRVDPPPGHEHEYAILYTGNTLPAVASECRVLTADPDDRYSWSSSKATQYSVVRYTFSAPAIFVPIDGGNRPMLGLDGPSRTFGSYIDYQRVALQLFRRFGQILHGLSWESFHRNQPGRVYALWHHHKTTVQLVRPAPPYNKLIDDPAWVEFLKKHPDVQRIDP